VSDDVRARAEALCDYLDKTSGGEEWKGASLVRQLRAALAVAPATAQPGAGSASFGVVDCDGVLYADSRDVAEGRVAVLNRSDIAGKPYRVVPLYAAPPATVDAAAVRLLRTLRGWLDVNERAWREAEVGCPTLIANVDAFLDAIPLPAPATAVEEARKAFYEAAMHAIGVRAAYGPDGHDAMNPSRKVHEAWRNVHRAEAEAAATHAAKGGNCG